MGSAHITEEMLKAKIRARDRRRPGWYGESLRHAQAAKGIKTGVLPKTGTVRAWPPARTKPKKGAYRVAYSWPSRWNPDAMFKHDVDAGSEKEARQAVKKYVRKTYNSRATKVKAKQIPVDEWGRRYQLIDSEGDSISTYLKGLPPREV